MLAGAERPVQVCGEHGGRGHVRQVLHSATGTLNLHGLLS